MTSINNRTKSTAESVGQRACEYLQERNVESDWNVRGHNTIFGFNFYTLYIHMQHGGLTQTISKDIKPWSLRKDINRIFWNTHSTDRKLSAVASILTKTYN